MDTSTTVPRWTHTQHRPLSSQCRMRTTVERWLFLDIWGKIWVSGAVIWGSLCPFKVLDTIEYQVTVQRCPEYGHCFIHIGFSISNISRGHAICHPEESPRWPWHLRLFLDYARWCEKSSLLLWLLPTSEIIQDIGPILFAQACKQRASGSYDCCVTRMLWWLTSASDGIVIGVNGYWIAWHPQTAFLYHFFHPTANSCQYREPCNSYIICSTYNGELWSFPNT